LSKIVTRDVAGSLNSTAGTTFRLEFFLNQSCDPSGFGEGETFVGFTAVSTDAWGNASFTASYPTTDPQLRFVTATAIQEAADHSSFSPDELDAQLLPVLPVARVHSPLPVEPLPVRLRSLAEALEIGARVKLTHMRLYDLLPVDPGVEVLRCAQDDRTAACVVGTGSYWVAPFSSACLAAAASSPKAGASLTARSASTLRSRVDPTARRPAISRL